MGSRLSWVVSWAVFPTMTAPRPADSVPHTCCLTVTSSCDFVHRFLTR